MPSALTYPGIYIEEVPNGARTITGVSASIAACAGSTAKATPDSAQRTRNRHAVDERWVCLSSQGFCIADRSMRGMRESADPGSVNETNCQ